MITLAAVLSILNSVKATDITDIIKSLSPQHQVCSCPSANFDCLSAVACLLFCAVLMVRIS